jgi:hypothetical protein
MTKKVDVKEDAMNINTAKIWCPEGENFQYIKACDVHCKKKDRCKPFRNYFEPKLF